MISLTCIEPSDYDAVPWRAQNVVRVASGGKRGSDLKTCRGILAALANRATWFGAQVDVLPDTGSTRTPKGLRYCFQSTSTFVNLSRPAMIGTRPYESRSAHHAATPQRIVSGLPRAQHGLVE
jgi:hypothetical protein